MMDLYTSKGYLDIPAIDRMTDAAGVSFVFIIGARQVGKTYGTLKHMIDDGRKFILMRRTQTEADFIASGAISPFAGMGYVDVGVRRDSKYTCAIERGEGRIGAVMALSTVAKIRGFSGAEYTDLVFDEFIPEQHVLRIKSEGDAFLNAVVTISGNREIEGKKPLKVWLLANSNNISSPILMTFGLTEKIESMQAKGQEYSIMPDRGIAIFLPESAEVLKLRKKTSIFRAVGGDSDFSRMAYDNEFAYNDPENVKHEDLSQYRPIISITDLLTVYKHKRRAEVYISKYRKGAREELPDTERGRSAFLRSFPNCKVYFLRGKTTFESLTLKEKYLVVIGIRR